MTPGVHTMSMMAYQADPAPSPSMSASIAHALVSQSPRHAWTAHPRLNPNHQSEESDKFDLGSCSHAVLLEGEEMIVAVEADDWRTKAAKEARDLARSEGKIPVLARKMPDIRAMANEARIAMLELQGMPLSFTEGDAERVLIWQEGDSWCRTRPDWISTDRKLIINYKTTDGSAEPGAWIRNQMTKMGFDVAALHELRGNAATGGAKNAQFIFLAQENYPPFECSFVGMSNAMLEIAQRKWDFALALWQRCMATGKWNGYPRRICTAEPALWQMDEDEERRLTFEERLEYATV